MSGALSTALHLPGFVESQPGWKRVPLFSPLQGVRAFEVYSCSLGDARPAFSPCSLGPHITQCFLALIRDWGFCDIDKITRQPLLPKLVSVNRNEVVLEPNS